MTSQGSRLSNFRERNEDIFKIFVKEIFFLRPLYTVRTITCWFETFINEQCCELLNPISSPPCTSLVLISSLIISKISNPA